VVDAAEVVAGPNAERVAPRRGPRGRPGGRRFYLRGPNAKGSKKAKGKGSATVVKGGKGVREA
jgi:hypothetical protein